MPSPAPAGQRSGMTSLETRFRDALSFDEMVATARSNVELYAAVRARAQVDPALADRIAATGRRWHLLALSEDWCGDSVNILPVVDALASAAPGVALRILSRDANLDLMDQHLTNGRARAIPVVLVLDDDFVERGWWGPRPRALQRWFEGAEAQAMTKDDRYKELRTRYARDRGRAIAEELTAIIEAAAEDAATQADAAAPILKAAS